MNLSILHTDEDMKKRFPPNSLLYTEEKRILRKFYLLPYFHLNLTKMKVISVIVINVISARIILYLTTNLSIRLLVECIVLEKAYLVTALMLFILFLVRIVETSM